MKEEIICEQINELIKGINEAVKTRNLDVVSQVKRLHTVRHLATKMEQGLKLRKEIMIKAGLEEEYQKQKGKAGTPGGTNKIAGIEDNAVKEVQEFEITIKKGDEILYQNSAHAAVMAIVEEISDIDDRGYIDGKAQHFLFGHDVAVMYGFDQLKQATEARMVQSAIAMQNSLKRLKTDPDWKARILKFASGKAR